MEIAIGFNVHIEEGRTVVTIPNGFRLDELLGWFLHVLSIPRAGDNVQGCHKIVRTVVTCWCIRTYELGKIEKRGKLLWS